MIRSRMVVSWQRDFQILLCMPEGPGAVLVSLLIAANISSVEGKDRLLCVWGIGLRVREQWDQRGGCVGREFRSETRKCQRFLRKSCTLSRLFCEGKWF